MFTLVPTVSARFLSSYKGSLVLAVLPFSLSCCLVCFARQTSSSVRKKHFSNQSREVCVWVFQVHFIPEPPPHSPSSSSSSSLIYLFVSFSVSAGKLYPATIQEQLLVPPKHRENNHPASGLRGNLIESNPFRDTISSASNLLFSWSFIKVHYCKKLLPFSAPMKRLFHLGSLVLTPRRKWLSDARTENLTKLERTSENCLGERDKLLLMAVILECNKFLLRLTLTNTASHTHTQSIRNKLIRAKEKAYRLTHMHTVSHTKRLQTWALSDHINYMSSGGFPPCHVHCGPWDI